MATGTEATLVWQIFYTGAGLVLLFRSGVVLYPIALFYLGRRREYWFMARQEWVKTIQDYGGGLATGVGLTLVGLLPTSLAVSYLLLILIGSFAIFFHEVGHRLIPSKPAWVRELEREHSPEDVEFIQQRGTELLAWDRVRFLKAINHPLNWEEWLVSVV